MMEDSSSSGDRSSWKASRSSGLAIRCSWSRKKLAIRMFYTVSVFGLVNRGGPMGGMLSRLKLSDYLDAAMVAAMSEVVAQTL